MGHDISLYIEEVQIDNCFPVVGEGNYKCRQNLEIDHFQDSLYITHNLSDIIYLGLTNIGETSINCWGDWLHNRSCLDAISLLVKLRLEIESHPDLYKPLEPKNGWGSYDGLVAKLRALYTACCEHPSAVIHDWY